MLKTYFEKHSEQFYALLRVIVGLMFVLHGAQKFGIIGDGTVAGFANMFGLSVTLGTIAASIELVGGLVILLGLFTRLAALLNGIVMLVALATVHFPKGLSPLANGGELALVYLLCFLVFMAKGNGKYGSLEKALLKKEHF